MKSEGNLNITISFGTVFKALLAVVFMGVLYELKEVLMVVLSSIVISSAIDPAVRWFENRKLPRILGVVIIYLVVASVILFFAVSVFPLFLDEMSSIVQNIPQYIDQISAYIPLLDESVFEGYVPLLQGIADRISSINISHALEIDLQNTADIFDKARAVIMSALGVVLTGVLAFYFSASKNGVENFLRIITPADYETYILDLWRRSKEKIAGWLQGQLVLGLVIGFLIYSVLAVLKVRHAFLLGITAGVFELIPVFGPTLSAIPAVILTILDRGIGSGLFVLAWFVIVQQLENHLLYPAVVKKIVGISPLVVIIALVVGGKLAGILGIILSVPLSVLIVEFIDDMDKRKHRNKIPQ